jgi:signal transduction histidine kinase
MNKGKLMAFIVIGAAVLALVVSATEPFTPPAISTILFWLALLTVADLLPVALGFGTQVTMSFPILLAVAIIFQPPLAMALAGIGSFDIREFRREIPLWRALFNRCQLLLATGAASTIIHLNPGDPFEFPKGLAAFAAGTIVFLLTNFGLVTCMVHLYVGVPVRQALNTLLPKPVGGFWLSQFVLAGLGAATAAVYGEIGPFVASFLIPLLFARLSILGARGQQELSEKVRKQQQALLEATERVFQEREHERHRIAEEIHDTSLQMLAAAAYGCGNATDLIDAGQLDRAREAVDSARTAVDGAMKALRESLVDLRRSTVEKGGLLETIKQYAEQVSLLWGTEVHIEGTISHEPPIPVALAAFQILQEGLVNALKHTHSGSITVRIGDADGMVHIVVEDQGPGFDPGIEVGAEHVGMRLMMERAARVGGRIELNTAPGSGTRLEAILPGGVAT